MVKLQGGFGLYNDDEVRGAIEACEERMERKAFVYGVAGFVLGVVFVLAFALGVPDYLIIHG